MLRVPFEFKRTGNDIEISFSYGASGGYTHTATETYNQSNRVVSMLYEVGYEQGVDKYTQMGTGDIRILFTP
jgi:hypothetical protein